MAAELPLSPQVFAILASLLEERVGLSYGPNDVPLLASKLSARAIDRGFDSLLDYYYFLRYDEREGETELEQLVETLVVHETFFFRELDQLVMMVDRFVGPRIAAGARPRIWSAACSTGEEPLSVAMLLAERGWLGKVDLVASDVSAAALARAQSGVHGKRAVRQAPPACAARWLEPCPEGWRVSGTLHAAIDWRRINLLDPKAVASVGLCDVILCRNVLFYFKDDMARAIVKRLAAQLVPGGGLFVGVAESLLRLGSELHCEEHDGVFVYRKAA